MPHPMSSTPAEEQASSSKGFWRMPFAGIISDLKGRSGCYVSDWTDGFSAHIHILAPSTYIFFASVIPALTFGEQLADETGGQINGVHVLISTAMCGVIQSIFGGQPLLIVGVAEPIVLVYAYMFLVAKTYEIPFLPWASATLFWVALICALLAVCNTCAYIHHFTRFSGELFGLLIAVLFLQQAIKGLASEFEPPHVGEGAAVGGDGAATDRPWLHFNGAFALFLASGLLLTSLVSITARGWNLYHEVVRRIISDYGTALCVLLWTLVSLAPSNTPEGIPRRLVIPNTFDGSSNYSVLSQVRELEAWQVGAALVPGIIIAVLFFFDHNVSSQLAQEGFNLKKPSAYHWDFLLLALMTLLCGLLGLPPVNGVIPQAPMHSRSNSVWRRGNGKETEEEAKFGDADFYIRENRVSNMLQSVLCGVCLLITPVLQQIPRSVLWGFFAFMALEGLPGNQFFRRIKLFVTDSTRVQNLLDDPAHESYLDTVPMPVILKFTACQLAGLLICYGITWAGIVGISFPLFIMILVPAREYLLPKFFANEHLQELDPLDLSEPGDKVEEQPSGARQVLPRDAEMMQMPLSAPAPFGVQHPVYPPSHLPQHMVFPPAMPIGYRQ